MDDSDSFLELTTFIRNTHCYKKCVCLSAFTDIFVNKHIDQYSRTRDQMIQSARSVKQNLVEGAYDGKTSKEMELKLFNVARGSLHELLDDYLDFLTNHQLKRWDYKIEDEKEKIERTRDKIKKEENPQFYIDLYTQCNPRTYVNIIITLIYQIDSLICGLLKKSEREFLENGGLKEIMYKHRLAARGRNKSPNYSR